MRPPRRHVLRYSENMTLPPGAEVFERRKLWMVITGAALFGVSWAFSITLGVELDEPSLFVPIAGPLIFQAEEGDAETFPLLLLGALAPAAGVLLFALGMRKKKYVQYWAVGEGRHLALTPTASPNYAGISATIW